MPTTPRTPLHWPLRRAGYRAENRHIVFKVLPDTLGLATEDWRVLDLAHERRNRAEYEGIVNIDEQLVRAVIAVAQKLLAVLEKSPPVTKLRTALLRRQLLTR